MLICRYLAEHEILILSRKKPTLRIQTLHYICFLQTDVTKLGTMVSFHFGKLALSVDCMIASRYPLDHSALDCRIVCRDASHEICSHIDPQALNPIKNFKVIFEIFLNQHSCPEV